MFGIRIGSVVKRVCAVSGHHSFGHSTNHARALAIVTRSQQPKSSQDDLKSSMSKPEDKTVSSMSTESTNFDFSRGKAGELVIENVGTVKGQLKNNKLDGKCTSTVDGKTYIGDYREGVLFAGSGLYEPKGGGWYVGEMQGGKKHGHGKHVLGKASYEGAYQNDAPHGKGVRNYIDGSSYSGDFVEGLRSGVGVQTSVSGVTYQGEWLRDREHGTGIITRKGQTYEAVFKHGSLVQILSVNGVSISTMGSTVTQEFGKLGTLVGSQVDGRMESWCIFTEPDETFHVGEYRAGVLVEGSGVIQPDFGGLYVGEVSKGRLHGQGHYHHDESGLSYSGGFKDDSFHGHGTQRSADGSSYVGEFKQGVCHGRGTHTSSGGIVYEGMWRDGRRHGEGTISDAQGEKFSGAFVNNTLVAGRGDLTLACGVGVAPFVSELIRTTFTVNHSTLSSTATSDDLLFGSFIASDVPIQNHKSVKNGVTVSRCTYSSGVRYTGSMQDGVPHGTGHVTGPVDPSKPANTPSDYEYSGEFVQGKRHGQGRLKHGPVIYEGSWAGNLRSGSGVEMSPLGTYNGTWANNQKHGQGVMSYADGGVYSGHFQCDRPHGAGSLTYSKGQWKLVGDFEDGHIYNGKGTFSYLDRIFYAVYTHGRLTRRGMYVKPEVFRKLSPGQVTAIRKDGRIVKVAADLNNTKKHVQGIEIYHDNCVYEGGFIVNHQKHGLGAFYAQDGTGHEGMWDSDRMLKSFKHW